VVPQEVLVDPRPVVETLEKTGTDQFAEVSVSLFVLHQQNQMMRGLTDSLGRSITPVSRRHVDLTPEDRFDPGPIHLLEKIDGTEHVPVIGHRHRRHGQLANTVTQCSHPNRTVQEAVFGVKVQVNEVFSHRFPSPRAISY